MAISILFCFANMQNNIAEGIVFSGKKFTKEASDSGKEYIVCSNKPEDTVETLSAEFAETLGLKSREAIQQIVKLIVSRSGMSPTGKIIDRTWFQFSVDRLGDDGQMQVALIKYGVAPPVAGVRCLTLDTSLGWVDDVARTTGGVAAFARRPSTWHPGNGESLKPSSKQPSRDVRSDVSTLMAAAKPVMPTGWETYECATRQGVVVRFISKKTTKEGTLETLAKYIAYRVGNPQNWEAIKGYICEGLKKPQTAILPIGSTIEYETSRSGFGGSLQLMSSWASSEGTSQEGAENTIVLRDESSAQIPTSDLQPTSALEPPAAPVEEIGMGEIAGASTELPAVVAPDAPIKSPVPVVPTEPSASHARAAEKVSNAGTQATMIMQLRISSPCVAVDIASVAPQDEPVELVPMPMQDPIVNEMLSQGWPFTVDGEMTVLQLYPVIWPRVGAIKPFLLSSVPELRDRCNVFLVDPDRLQIAADRRENIFKRFNCIVIGGTDGACHGLRALNHETCLKLNQFNEEGGIVIFLHDALSATAQWQRFCEKLRVHPGSSMDASAAVAEYDQVKFYLSESHPLLTTPFKLKSRITVSRTHQGQGVLADDRNLVVGRGQGCTPDADRYLMISDDKSVAMIEAGHNPEGKVTQDEEALLTNLIHYCIHAQAEKS